MAFNIDIAIVAGFLLLTLGVGVFHGRGNVTIQDYALGGRNFSTAALVATIVATYASGSEFFVTLSRTYSNGFYHLFATTGIVVSFLITAFILIPRMEEFIGKISIAEAMGHFYGKKVRLFVAVAATIGSSGLVAVQFKVFGGIFSYFLPISNEVAIVIAGVITTLYSAFGGIRAVTFTDIIQFFAFGVIIPLIGFLVWNQFYYNEMQCDLQLAFSQPKFDLKALFDISSDKFPDFVALFIYFSIPTISAPKFQRIAMGASIYQVKKAFIISTFILVLIKFFVAWIPFLIYSINPNLDPNNILIYIVDNFTFQGLKGLVLVAIIAFSMSTADSRINASSVLFTHDIYFLLVKSNKSELFISRVASYIIGFSTISLALLKTDLLSTIIFANSFYHPLILPPFFLTLFGFRSSSKSILCGMFAGLIATTIWKFIPVYVSSTMWKVLGLVFAMFCNTLFLLSYHYLLNQPGGWKTKYRKKSIKIELNNKKNLLEELNYSSIKKYF